MSEIKSSGSGIGLSTVLFLIFMTLKLTGHIDWSWWWVTAPLWGTVALILLIMLSTAMIFGIAWVAMAWCDKKGK
jgi:hypothetical protein